MRRANAAAPNERFRPDIHARPPRASETLLDLRKGLTRRLDIDGAHAAHYWLEDARGVRLLDLHNGVDQPVHLVRPPPSGPVYVRRDSDGAEFTVPASPEVLSLADLEAQAPRVATRGAAHEAFNLLFSLPFEHRDVEAYVETQSRPPADAPLSPKPGTSLGRVLGWNSVSLGVVSFVDAVALSASAITVAHRGSPQEDQLQTASRNDRVSTYNRDAAVGYIAGGVLVAVGLAGLLWPASRHIQPAISPSGTSILYQSSF